MGAWAKGTAYTRAAHTSLGMSLVLLISARHRMTMFLLHENLLSFECELSHDQHTHAHDTHTHDTRHTTHDTHTHDTRHTTHDTRHTTHDTRHVRG